jgi:ER-derived vesicles protein
MSQRIYVSRPAPQGSYMPDTPLHRQQFNTQYGEANTTEDLVSKIRAISSQVEDYIDIYSQPLRPHLPAIGRFLIVVTFLEDALRIITQWGDQVWYLQKCVYNCVLSPEYVTNALD